MAQSTKDKLVLEFNLSNHQMMHMTFIGLVVVVGGVSFFIDESGVKLFISIFGFIALLSIIIAFTFSKKGLLKKNGKLYNGYFFGNKILFKKSINVEGKSTFTVLKLRKSQKMAFFAGGNPDLSQSFDSFDIALLNEKHTKKNIILTLKKEKSSELVTKFLNTHMNWDYEIYSPDFS